MKTLSSALLAAGLLGALGCGSQSTPGGPGATKPGANRPAVGQVENSFKLDVPNLETTIKQGETKTVTIGIDRGKNFDQDVKLDFSGAPQGVKVTAANPEIKASDKEVQVSIEATKEAAVGHHTITVTGTPAREGAKGSAEIKIEVQKPS